MNAHVHPIERIGHVVHCHHEPREPRSAFLARRSVGHRPGEGDHFKLGGFGIDWKIDGLQTDKRFSVVHHPMAPRALAAPLHRHRREDEYSYVLTGRLGALLGDEVVTAEPGSWVFKPRGQWHTFWNASDELCEIIEVISPAGFEDYFRELAVIWPDRTKSIELLRKYELDMDFDSVPGLCARFGLISARPESKLGSSPG